MVVALRWIIGSATVPTTVEQNEAMLPKSDVTLGGKYRLQGQPCCGQHLRARHCLDCRRVAIHSDGSAGSFNHYEPFPIKSPNGVGIYRERGVRGGSKISSNLGLRLSASTKLSVTLSNGTLHDDFWEKEF
jgi:hypothetical protein